MKEFLTNLKPRDYIAVIVVLGGLYLLATGRNGLIGGLLVTITAYYFGRRKDNGFK